ncbi:transcriptional repressor LexA [Pontiella agarivorans]|uniref:Transcriptional repressor LexA n=1 Tax=Pontiella agarivorans TaxID=3038953 RepID=A0ABU5N0X6_9BACT|nr:transcriptional repressor LexA [Pontiella agarivorans]MDZ8120099.1 transcriptional repressor LexA [Pontiella agarivorans]
MPRTINLAEKIEQLRAFYDAEGRAPSYAEMANLFGYKSKNAVYGPVNKLLKLGYLDRGSDNRILLTTKITGSTKLLGSVQAGFPSPAEEELVDSINLDQYLVRRPEATYLLTVSGESMIDAGIQPGDLVLVEKGGAPKQNDIVVAQIDGEWTLKYFGKDETGVYLDPANSAFTRMRPERTLSIGGIVKAVVRKYNT